MSQDLVEQQRQPGVAAPRTRTAPVSFAQERLWTLEQIEPGNPANNLRAAFQVTGPLDPHLVERAVNEVVVRHEALRTTYAVVGARPVQVIADPEPVPVGLVDLSAVDARSRETELERSITAEIQAPFDLASPPLVRVTLFRAAPERHVLLFVTHHIVCDGWSLGVLIREVLAFYAALADGTDAGLTPLPLQYRDFASWQREHLTGERYSRLAEYWTRQLHDAPALLPLPTDRPRPPVQTYRGSAQTRRLPPSLVIALERLGRRDRATLFMVLLSGFGALLSRYADRDDVVLGTPIANRRRAEDEALIGFFVNTLVMRVDLDGDPSFSTLLRRVREMTLDAYDHQDMPFEKLVEELNPPRSASHSALFQVMFVLQNMPIPHLEAGGVRCEPLDVRSGTSRFDLTLFAWRGTDGLELVAEYNCDLFDDETIGRFLAHFEHLLAAAAEDPDRPVSRLPLVEPDGSVQLGGSVELHGSVEPDRSAEPSSVGAVDAELGNPFLHGRFEDQVRRTPEAVALRSPAGDLTYAQLNRRADELARRLVEAGVKRGDLVGVHLDRSPDLVVALLGVLKAEAAYVPLGPEQPASRLEHVLRDSGLGAVVTRQRSTPEWTARGVLAVAVDRDASGVTGEGEIGSHHGTSAHDEAAAAQRADGSEGDQERADDGVAAAYVMYTSGSTGQPRGVVGLHRGAVNRIDWMAEAYPFEVDEVCCQKTSLSFVDSVAEIFGPLLNGVPQVLVSDEDAKDPRRLLEILDEQRVTRLVVVPSLLRAMLSDEPALGRRLPCLRLCVTSGEVLTPELRDAFHRAAPGTTLLNLYGSTEVSADVLWHDTRKDPPGSQVPIGRPIARTAVHLLDRHLQPVPVGVPGEIHVAGAGVAGGYHRRPELTAERFLTGTAFTAPGEALYRTGDLGRRAADGTVYFLGRRDRQVKIRGYRIELAEVEAALLGHPAVAAAAVVASETTAAGEAAGSDRRLVAYVVPGTGDAPAASELRSFLLARLPAYMVPGVFVPLERLPLTTSGKLDQRRLPAPDAGAGTGGETTTPRNQLEWQLKGIWERCLDRGDIGIHDDFFELGGHSLLALQLTQDVEQLSGRPLPLVTLFEAPTIAQLAAVLRDAGWQPRWRSLVPVRTRGSKTPFFLVPGIRGLALNLTDLARQLDPDRPLYGLQARAFAGDDVDTQVEDMAAAYVAELRLVQPAGPYLIGGVCFGAKVAFEMARQLTAAGQEVAEVVLIEGYAPRVLGFRSRLRRTRRRIGRVAAQARGLPPRQGWQLALDEARRNGRPRNALIDASDAPLHVTVEAVRRANLRAARAYAPPPYPGRIVVLRGDDMPEFGWHRMATGGVELHDVSGIHARVLEQPYVATLGPVLNACLDRTGV